MEPVLYASPGTKELARWQGLPRLRTGNATLDQLVGGGIEPGLPAPDGEKVQIENVGGKIKVYGAKIIMPPK